MGPQRVTNPPYFSIGIETDGATCTIVMSGELDLGSAPALEAALDDAQQQPRPIIVDLCDVTFVDSSGIRALLRAAELSRANAGRLRIRLGESSQVARILELTAVIEQLPLDQRGDWDSDRSGGAAPPLA